MGVSVQRHTLAALYPGERTRGTHCTGGWVDIKKQVHFYNYKATCFPFGINRNSELPIRDSGSVMLLYLKPKCNSIDPNWFGKICNILCC